MTFDEEKTGELLNDLAGYVARCQEQLRTEPGGYPGMYLLGALEIGVCAIVSAIRETKSYPGPDLGKALRELR